MKSIPSGVKKNATRNFDAKKLDYIETQLSLLNQPIACLREVTFQHPRFHTQNKCRIPDLILNKQVFLEHDTAKIHGELGYANKKTLRRNCDYHRAGIDYVIINQDLAKECHLDEADLAQYLYYHKLAEIQARKEVRG